MVLQENRGQRRDPIHVRHRLIARKASTVFYFDKLMKLFSEGRPRHRPAEARTIDRVPCYVRIFKTGQVGPVAVVELSTVQIQDYAAAKIEDGNLVRDEREAGVYFDCVLPSVHADKSHEQEEGHVEARQGKTLNLREKAPPNHAEATAGV